MFPLSCRSDDSVLHALSPAQGSGISATEMLRYCGRRDIQVRDQVTSRVRPTSEPSLRVVRPYMNERRRRNAALNEAEYAAAAETLSSYPRFVLVELTENCNLHCPMCRPARRYEASRNLPFHLFEEIAETLFPYAELVDLRGWGESLIYPDIVHAIELAASYGPQLKIYTNLTVSNSNILEALMRHKVITAVSFDAASSKSFSRLRGGANIDTVRKNLERLISLRDTLLLPPQFVYFSVAVQEANLGEIADILQIASDSGISLVKLFPLCTSILDPNHPFRHQMRIQSLLDDVMAVASALRIDVQLGAALHPSLVRRSALFDRCSHPWTHCCVTHVGGVGFCDHLIGLPHYSVGSLKVSRFREIWNNLHFRSLRRQHREAPDHISGQYSSCRWCYRFRYSDTEHWLRPCESARSVATWCGEPLYQLHAPSSESQDTALTFP